MFRWTLSAGQLGVPSIRYSTERGDHLEGPAESSGPGVHEDDRAAALGRSEGYNSKRLLVASTALGLASSRS